MEEFRCEFQAYMERKNHDFVKAKDILQTKVHLTVIIVYLIIFV